MSTSGKPTIYRNLQEMVNPEHTVLVVWDVQNALVNRSFNKDDFLKNIKVLIKAARDSNIPLIYTKITPLPINYESPFRLYMQMKRSGITDLDKLPTFMSIGSPEAEIYSEVSPADNDIVLNKHTPSIFIGTHFENMMRNQGVDTIVFTGISTEIGIASSARDSANRGFYTVVAEDCVSTSNKEVHESTLKLLESICVVVPSQEIMKEWK